MIYKSESQEARDLLQKCQTYWREGIGAMEHRRKKWKDNYSWWNNRQLAKNRPLFKSDARINYCWVVTSVKIPVLTQNQPTCTFIPYGDSEEEQAAAELRSKVVGNALWNKLEILDQYQDVCFHSSLYDAGVYKVFWDPDEGPTGEIGVVSLEPFKFIPDPMARKTDDMRYCVHVEPYAVSALKVKYPEFANRISAEGQISSILFEERKFADNKPTTESYSHDTQFQIERAHLKEFWLTSDAFLAETEEEYKDEDGKKQKRKKNKYPNGLIVTMINDNLIVDVKKNPYPWKFGFVPACMNKVGGEFWGKGDIEQIIPIQRSLNHITQQLDDIMNTVANVGWTVDPRVGDETIRKLVRALQEPGSVKPVLPDQLRADDPPQVPAVLVRMQQEYIQRIFDISGISDILQGSGRVTHRTARGIERLFEAATSRIGQSVQNHELALKKVFAMMGDLAEMFYKEDRMFALFGGSGQMEGSLPVPTGSLKGEFEVSIDSGATLPQDKKSRAELTLELNNAGILEMAAIGDPAHKEIARVVLEAVEFPKRERLLAIQPPPPELPPEPMEEQIPPEAMMMAQETGIPPEALQAIVEQAASGQPQMVP